MKKKSLEDFTKFSASVNQNLNQLMGGTGEVSNPTIISVVYATQSGACSDNYSSVTADTQGIPGGCTTETCQVNC